MHTNQSNPLSLHDGEFHLPRLVCPVQFPGQSEGGEVFRMLFTVFGEFNIISRILIIVALTISNHNFSRDYSHPVDLFNLARI